MKNIFIFITALLFTSCVIDKIPTKEIEIDQDIISFIDSLEVTTRSEHYGIEKNCKEVQENQKEYVFTNWGYVGDIRIKLKNKTEIKLEQIRLNKSDRLFITKVNDQYIVEPKNSSTFLYLAKLFLIGLIVVFLTKVLIALLIIRPILSKDFIIKYGLFNLIYAIIYILIFVLSIDSILLAIIVLPIVAFMDFLYLYKYIGVSSKIKSIFTVIITDTLLFCLLAISIYLTIFFS